MHAAFVAALVLLPGYEINGYIYIKLNLPTMKNIILSAVIFLMTSTLAFAQREGKTRFSIGPELGIATSNPLRADPQNKGWGLGIGGSAEVEHFFKQNVSGVFYVGFIGYNGRSTGNSVKNKAYTAIPFRIGSNLYAGHNFHLGAQVGVGINNIGGVGRTTFAYTPEVGYNFKNKNDKPLDLTFKFDGYAGHGGFSAIGLRLSLFL
jgi:hypothetical protein